MITIVDSQRQIDERDLAHIEKAIDGPLPEQYRSFLLAHNGGRPRPNSIDIEGAHFQTTDVNVLYAIDDPIESCDILWNLEHLEGCQENRLLPIASDSGANTFVIVVAKEDYGRVYYFDASEIPPRPYHIANDFNEFLGKLRELTPEELADIDAAALGPDNP